MRVSLGAWLPEKEVSLMKRLILKLSGEALASTKGSGYDDEKIESIAGQIKTLTDEGFSIGIIIGGGNIWRGRTNDNIDRTKSDAIGMLATVMNCIYVSEVFRSQGLKTQIFTPFAVGTMTKLFSKDESRKCFDEGCVCFYAGGTGNPYFSTDTGVILRALELDADMVLLAKSIDGVYDSDPATNPNAKKYVEVTIDDVLDQKLKVVDLTATIMAYENRMPMQVFALDAPNGIVRAAHGENLGTMVTAD